MLILYQHIRQKLYNNAIALGILPMQLGSS